MADRMRAACALLACLLLAGCMTAPVAEPGPARATTGVPELLASELVAAANDARGRNGARELSWNPALAAAAEDFVRELARRGTLTHTSERPGYATLFERIDRAGGSVVRAGENLAALSARSMMPAHVIRMWLESAGHRRNLLDDGYTLTGAAAARAGGTWYFVQVYATPPRRLP